MADGQRFKFKVPKFLQKKSGNKSYKALATKDKTGESADPGNSSRNNGGNVTETSGKKLQRLQSLESLKQAGFSMKDKLSKASSTELLPQTEKLLDGDGSDSDDLQDAEKSTDDDECSNVEMMKEDKSTTTISANETGNDNFRLDLDNGGTSNAETTSALDSGKFTDDSGNISDASAVGATNTSSSDSGLSEKHSAEEGSSGSSVESGEQPSATGYRGRKRKMLLQIFEEEPESSSEYDAPSTSGTSVMEHEPFDDVATAADLDWERENAGMELSELPSAPIEEDDGKSKDFK
ncbi:uncharacterized protein LOC101859748 [Aplysia californica]|uniref:Uncharacterized protein LOC101859748 n=1 Tax=Aplysia californica TaxID=6500 RepID=A0ABM1AD34_APLCA|nr:uncharacterized protein LOC101859748 [Aplysia californica]